MKNIQKIMTLRFDGERKAYCPSLYVKYSIDPERVAANWHIPIDEFTRVVITEGKTYIYAYSPGNPRCGGCVGVTTFVRPSGCLGAIASLFGLRSTTEYKSAVRREIPAGETFTQIDGVKVVGG